MVVLPFADLSLKPGNEYFSDGLTEGIDPRAHQSARPARSSVDHRRAAARPQQDFAAIREQLGAAFVLTGSARIAGPSLRVRAQLIDTATGVYLWCETFDRRDARRVRHPGRDCARHRAHAAPATTAGGAGRWRAPPRRINSYDHYLKGRYYWHRRTPADLERSVEYFRAAVELDPLSSLAHTGLADAWSLLVDYGLMNPDEGMPKARAAAARAIALDPAVGRGALFAGADPRTVRLAVEKPNRSYRRAIELNPGYATAHHWLAVDCHAMLGRLDEATAGLESGPATGSAIQHRAGRARLHAAPEARLRAAAAKEYRRLTVSDPDFYKGYTGHGRAHALQGNYLDALRMLDQGRAMAGDIPNILAAWDRCTRWAARRNGLAKCWGGWRGMLDTGYVPSTAFAIVHLGLGEHERALDWLEKGAAIHDPPLCR